MDDGLAKMDSAIVEAVRLMGVPSVILQLAHWRT